MFALIAFVVILSIAQGSTVLGDDSDVVISITDEYYGSKFQINDLVTGDVNGDGMDDILVCSPYNIQAAAKTNRGGCHLVWGNASGISVDIPVVLTEQGVNFYPAENSWDTEYYYFGYASAMADLNNDGYCDIIIGGIDNTGAHDISSGIVWIVYGNPNLVDMDLPITQGQTLENNVRRLIGETSHVVHLGSSLTVLDYNGDDNLDIVVGASLYSSSKDTYELYYAKSGGAFVWLLDGLNTSEHVRATGDRNVGTVASPFKAIANTHANDNIGDLENSCLSNAGDMDQDGKDDILLSRNTDVDTAGTLNIIYGDGTNGRITLPLNSTTVGFSVTGNASGDKFGFSCANIGDFNNDKLPDILVGAPGNSGSAYIIFGTGTRPSSVSRSITDLLATGEAMKLTSGDGYTIGFDVFGPGDVNGDTIADILVSSSDFSHSSITTGAVFAIFGSTNISGELVAESSSLLEGAQGYAIYGGEDTGAVNGNARISTGDVNGDGVVEVIFGSKSALNAQLTVTAAPTQSPSDSPTNSPTHAPSKSPTVLPSMSPSESPTTWPSMFPSVSPSTSPSTNPTKLPTIAPSAGPSIPPTLLPTLSPSVSPTHGPIAVDVDVSTGASSTEGMSTPQMMFTGIASFAMVAGIMFLALILRSKSQSRPRTTSSLFRKMGLRSDSAFTPYEQE